MKPSTHDKIEGTSKEVKGAVKQATGKVTGNQRLKDEGQGEKIAGKVQRKVGQIEKVFES